MRGPERKQPLRKRTSVLLGCVVALALLTASQPEAPTPDQEWIFSLGFGELTRLPVVEEDTAAPAANDDTPGLQAAYGQHDFQHRDRPDAP